MKRLSTILLTGLAVAFLACAQSCDEATANTSSSAASQHDDEADAHDHQDDAPDLHDDHDHGTDDEATASHDDDDDHDGESLHEVGHIVVPIEQRGRLDVQLATAEPGHIEVTKAFPGEVVPDPGRLAHVMPRADGIVREVAVRPGDQVRAGDILAWVESNELAEAKLQFYSKQSAVGCCKIEVPRARNILDNTHKLLAEFKDAPTTEQLARFDVLEMGDLRGKLVSAYAELVAARRIFEREQDLYEKNVSSESEYLAAEAAYKTAHARLAAASDTATFDVLINYTDSVREQQVAEFEAVAAEHRLRLMGVDDEAIDYLTSLVPQPAGYEPCLCDDPNCDDGEIPSVMESLGREHRLGWYALRAPFAGYVTDMHLSLGEKITKDESVITITDTSSVWVHFSIYQKDLLDIRTGQPVTVDAGFGAPVQKGRIARISPILDSATRTVPARLELANPDGVLRPGLYVTAHVEVEPVVGQVVIPNDAIQTVDHQSVVFVPEGDGEYAALAVTPGSTDGFQTVILAGLEPGMQYVAHGAFDLKSMNAISNSDAHAGHGH
ncbi:MAG: efflux RND transporter periplasmic adaptor subunit [Planctomycetes bacterium]|nr:efflux RND transporter periplasmic adaptor subunit [Planctomycetota bacterium]NOG55755.1 efflux RND transporter periplasmic adaptor subunit [Planctomycetota bacterium]